MLFLHRNEDHEPWWPGLQPTKSLVIDALPQCERMSRCLRITAQMGRPLFLRSGRFKFFGKEVKESLRIMTRDHVIRSIFFSFAPGRNSNYRHITNVLELPNRLFKREVIHLGVNYDHIDIRKSIQ
jgi:hypothetical protein